MRMYMICACILFYNYKALDMYVLVNCSDSSSLSNIEPV